jgi:hypothetical protein
MKSHMASWIPTTSKADKLSANEWKLEISKSAIEPNKNHLLSKVAAGIEIDVAYWFGFNRARVGKVYASI